MDLDKTGRRLAGEVRRLARHLPVGVRRRIGTMARGRSRVREREILGTPLRMEGANHTEQDYDDAWMVALIAGTRGFVDVGCNIGYFSLIACVLNPEAEVLAVDANPDCAAVAAANLVRNGFGDRGRVVSSFVSSAAGEVQFHTVGLGAAGSGVAGFANTAEAKQASQVVGADSLDAIVARTHISPELIKVDVEGAEREVLAGAVEITKDHAPRFVVEMHSVENLSMRENTEDVLAWCEEQGYAAWYLAEGRRIHDAGPVAHRGRCHLLLQPASLPYPPVLEGIGQGAPLSEALQRIRT